MITRKYYYFKLSPLLRDVLDNILDKLQKHESEITIINPSVTAEQIGKLFDIIDKDFPEIFLSILRRALLKLQYTDQSKRLE